MSSMGTGYDLSASQFSPDGRVFQIEYALKAIDQSGTALGVRGRDGCILAVEKLITSKLHERGSNKRLLHIDEHIGMATTGVYPDGRHLAETARVEASNFRWNFGTPVKCSHLAERVASYVHAYTLYSSVRPFGGVAILASWTPEDGPNLFAVEPSGSTYGYYGVAFGKGKANAKTEIEKLPLKERSIRDLLKDVVKIMLVVHDESKDKPMELELSWIGESTGGRHQLVPAELLTEVQAQARREIEDAEQGDAEMK